MSIVLTPPRYIAKEQQELVRLGKGRRLQNDNARDNPACGTEEAAYNACIAPHKEAGDACDACDDELHTCDHDAVKTHKPSTNYHEQCSDAFCAAYDTCNDADNTCYDSIDPTCDELCADEEDALDDCKNPEFDFEYEFEDPDDETTAEDKTTTGCYCPASLPPISRERLLILYLLP